MVTAAFLAFPECVLAIAAQAVASARGHFVAYTASFGTVCECLSVSPPTPITHDHAHAAYLHGLQGRPHHHHGLPGHAHLHHLRGWLRRRLAFHRSGFDDRQREGLIRRRGLARGGRWVAAIHRCETTTDCKPTQPKRRRPLVRALSLPHIVMFR